MIFAGVDGGNSKTEAIVANAQGRVLASARGGPSDIHAMRPEDALDEAVRVLAAAVRTAAPAVPLSALGGAAFSLAGADWPEDFELIRANLRRRLGADVPLMVVNDAVGALRAGSDAWTGVSVVCGTSNAVGARGRDGGVFHLGSWPDTPGGEKLARGALDAVFREALGLGPRTALTPAILEHFHQPNGMALLHAVHRRDSPLRGGAIRNLAPLILDVADAGDPLARTMAEQIGRVLAAQARVAASGVDLALDGAEVVVNGGLFHHPSHLIFGALADGLPGARVIRAKAPPVLGALLLAFDQARVTVDSRALAASARDALGPRQIQLGALSPLSLGRVLSRARRSAHSLMAEFAPRWFAAARAN